MNTHHSLHSASFEQCIAIISVLLFLKVLNVSPDMSDNLFQVISAILWIGNLKFEDTESEACRLTGADRQTVRRIAHLLGLEETQVVHVCTSRQITVKGTTTDIALKYHEVCSIPPCILMYFICWSLVFILSSNQPSTLVQ